MSQEAEPRRVLIAGGRNGRIAEAARLLASAHPLLDERQAEIVVRGALASGDHVIPFSASFATELPVPAGPPSCPNHRNRRERRACRRCK